MNLALHFIYNIYINYSFGIGWIYIEYVSFLWIHLRVWKDFPPIGITLALCKNMYNHEIITMRYDINFGLYNIILILVSLLWITFLNSYGLVKHRIGWFLDTMKLLVQLTPILKDYSVFYMFNMKAWLKNEI